MPEYFSENLETQARRRGSPSRRIGRGKDLAVRALRPVDLVLSVQPGRLPRRGRPVARAFRRRRRRRRATPRRCIAKRCSSRCSAARAAAASRGSSRKRYAGARALDGGKRQAQARAPSERSARSSRVAAAVILHAATAACCSRSVPPGKAVRGLLGISRRQARARRNAARDALERELREELGIDGARAPRRGSCSASSIRTRTSSSISSACSRGTASPSATTARRSRGRRPALRRSRRCCRRTRACCAR